MAINPPLLALAIGAFGIGVTEFTPMGMLPLIAGDLGVSIPAAGLVVSAYALGVLVGAPLMTLASARLPRRRVLVGLMAIFTLGNLMAALADGYAMLVAARLVTALNHGAFFGIGSVVAAGIVPPERRAAAVASMFSGLAIATIGGVPLAAWTGETFGWRAAFWGIAAVGALAMLALRLALPDLKAEAGIDMRAELRVLGRGPVLAALALTMVGFSAMFTLFTYIVPILHGAAGAAPAFVTGMLALFGVGLTLGNWLGGRLADRSVDGTLIGALAAQVVILVLFAGFMSTWGLHQPAALALLIVLWGVASFATVSPLQMRVMDEAGAAPNLASAMNIGAFNLGNAIGAALGGGVIDAGLGLPAVPLAAAGLAAAGLALLLWLRRDGRVRADTAAACG